MKIFVLRSERKPDGPDPAGDYIQTLDTRYAKRVIANLENRPGQCATCGPECVACRRPYGRDFAEAIAGEAVFPAVLPYVLERPERHVPADVPRHDALIAVAVHEQILLECLKRCGEWGARGVMVPIEEPGWISGAAREQAERICARQGVEIAFPKPFCDLAPPEGSFLAEFRRRFHIGRPEVEFRIEGERIVDVDVKVSAPCGATYYIARWLKGRSLDDDLKYEVVSKRLHSYPCTSSMEWDDDLGDTILHVAGKNHYALLDQLGQGGPARPEMVKTPLGKTLPKPVSVAENLRNVQQARAFILQRLSEDGEAPLSALRRGPHTAAALNTALIELKREGKVEMRGASVIAPKA